jgi:hypothetical protein
MRKRYYNNLTIQAQNTFLIQDDIQPSGVDDRESFNQHPVDTAHLKRFKKMKNENGIFSFLNIDSGSLVVHSPGAIVKRGSSQAKSSINKMAYFPV